MKFLIKEQISPHRYKTPEGYLVCVDAVLARTGKQEYRKNEVYDCNDEDIIEINRREEDVFSPETIASFENKPVTWDHPDTDVNPENHRDLAVGYVRDVHRGEDSGQPVIMGNLIITDAEVIEAIENGDHCELSCGYSCDITDDDDPRQINIRGNHVALCEHGRAGNARIVDSDIKDVNDLRVVEFLGNNHLVKKLRGLNHNKIGTIRQVLKEEQDFNPKLTDDELKEIARRLKVDVRDSVDDTDDVLGRRSEGMNKIKDKKNWEYSDELQRILENAGFDTYSEYSSPGYRGPAFVWITVEDGDINRALRIAKAYANKISEKYFQVEAINQGKEIILKVKDSVNDARWGNNDKVLTKEDAIRELKTARIKEGENWDAGDERRGWYVQIQNHGLTEVEVNIKTGYTGSKEKSSAWGRIWKDGKFMFKEEGPLNVVRQNMIRFIQSSQIDDSETDKYTAIDIVRLLGSVISKHPAKLEYYVKNGKGYAKFIPLRSVKDLEKFAENLKNDLKAKGWDSQVGRDGSVLAINKNLRFTSDSIDDSEMNDDWTTTRRIFRESDIGEEGSYLGTTEWGTPKGSLYVYRKNGKIIAEAEGVAAGDPKGTFEFNSLKDLNRWLLKDSVNDDFKRELFMQATINVYAKEIMRLMKKNFTKKQAIERMIKEGYPEDTVRKAALKVSDSTAGDYYHKIDSWAKEKYPDYDWEVERVGYIRIYDPHTGDVIKSSIPTSSILKDSISDEKIIKIAKVFKIMKK